MVSTLRSVLIALLLFAAVGGSVHAASEKPGSVYNKVKFLDWLVHSSPVSVRIEKSDDEEAKQQLKRAREMWEQASEHSEKEEFELAEVHISEGLKLMTKVSRKFKDQDRVKQARIDLYKQVKGHVEMFVVVFDRIADEKGGDHIRKMLDREKIDSLMATAEEQYADGDLAMANHLMRQAADMVDHALSNARHEEVLLRELSFESLEEEYAYEVQRNESYVMIIDMLQKKKTAKSQASASFVQKMIDANAKMRQQADAAAEKGDFEEGIALLEKSTDKLSRALRVSGASF
ncbi:MAG: hypothetical protein JSW45_05020 [Thiotrichales bacterium]|nr:MAG: hypothetical protein JSW45_05020 [Thiotrichales bacterium]